MKNVSPPIWLPPSTSKPNQVLLSTGVGSNVKWGYVNTGGGNSSGNATSLNTTAYPVTAAPTTIGQVLVWDGTNWVAGKASQAWAVTNANANTSMSASATYTPSAWTITASGFSNYLVHISCTVRMTAATAGTCSIGIRVGGSLYGATSGTTYGAINAQSVTVNGTYLLSSVSGTQVIQGQVTPGNSAGVFFNGNMSVIGIS
jgi:hypothetical protein